MRAALVGVLVIAAVACRGDGGPPAPLAPAGGDKDDGHGMLTSALSRVALGDGDGSSVATDDGAPARNDGDYVAYGGDVYGGMLYGGDPYGGAMYGGVIYGGPNWTAGQPHPIKYEVQDGLTGSLEGTVTWQGPPPPRIATACGLIDNPSVRVTNKAVGGALVYIENVKIGRSTPTGTYGSPPTVGGVVAKHGCALLPAAQVVAPLPASFTVHGDATRATLRITPPSAAAKTVELQEAGLASMDTETGVTRVDGSDGKLSSAWLVGLDTPYFAITDDAGHYAIDELAEGDYDITVWQAPIATAGANGVISYGAPIVVHRKVHVAAKVPARLDVALGGR